MTRTIFRALAALAIVFAFGHAPAAAQTGQMFGELVGQVTDDQGGVLPGVTVTLTGRAAMGAPTAVTNERGIYRFPAVNSGTYTLTFELAGFAQSVREDIVVPVRQTVTVDQAMKLASLQETVTVSGSSPTVDVENTKVGARLSQDVLTTVPTSRTIFGSTTVLPGMTMGRQDPGGLNCGDVDRHGRARRGQLQPELLRRDGRHAAELRLDVLHGLRVGGRDFGRHRGDGRGGRRRRRREHQRHPEDRRQLAEGQRAVERHRQGLLGRVHQQQHHGRTARAGHHRPDAAQPERLQRRRRRAVPQGSSVVVRIVPQLLDGRGDARPTRSSTRTAA